jgi:hypothetical protein
LGRLCRIGKQADFFARPYLKFLQRRASRRGGGSRTAGPGAEPVVEVLLRAAAAFKSIRGFSLADEGLGLAALDALGEILLAEARDFAVDGRDARDKRGGMASCRLRFDEGADAVGLVRCGCDASPAAAFAGTIAFEGEPKRVQAGKRGFKRQALLFLFEAADVQQAAESSGDGHG